MRTWNIQNAEKTLYSRIVELLLQLVETQHNRMYSLYIGSLCNVAFQIPRFTCIVTAQVFVEI